MNEYFILLIVFISLGLTLTIAEYIESYFNKYQNKYDEKTSELYKLRKENARLKKIITSLREQNASMRNEIKQ